MKRKKNDVWNLVFSAFLVTAFLVCASFFIGMIHDSYAQDTVKETLFTALVFVLFGLLLFYATRVGDGKQVVRFSAVTLILMVLPALYVIVASAAAGWPFHEAISQRRELVNIAAVILGYGIPYTFVSGFELVPPDAAVSRNNTATEAKETAASTAAVQTAATEQPDTVLPAEESGAVTEAMLDAFSDAPSEEGS